MLYVQRDAEGNVVGVYANPQPQPDGSCLTDPDPLPDDHQDIVDYRSRADG